MISTLKDAQNIKKQIVTILLLMMHIGLLQFSYIQLENS